LESFVEVETAVGENNPKLLPSEFGLGGDRSTEIE
jgi:hypothetical protein